MLLVATASLRPPLVVAWPFGVSPCVDDSPRVYIIDKSHRRVYMKLSIVAGGGDGAIGLGEEGEEGEGALEEDRATLGSTRGAG